MRLPARRVLFVCTGNICRSVLAEYLLKRMSAERGLSLEVKSCGVGAEAYFLVPPEVRALLAAEGFPALGHKARLADRELLRWAEAVLTMTRQQREYLLGRFPEFTAKISTLRGAAGFTDEDVDDPLGGPPEVFRACRDRIRQSLETLLGAAGR